MKKNALVLFAATAALAIFCAGFAFFSKTDTSGKEAPENPEKLSPAELFFHIRNYPDQHFDLKAYTQALNEAQNLASLKSLPGFNAPWTVRGPGNIGARINSIAVHPLNEDIIYAGFAAGGLFKTTNGGASWLPIFDDHPFLAIGCVSLDPQDPNVVYVGTGDPNISAYPFIGDGLYKSTDGGQSWQNLGLSEQRIISKVLVNPQNTNIIYAACMGLPFERNDERGLYRSTNGGQSWQQVLFVSNQAGIIDLVMDPQNPQVLYAASWDRIRNNMESTISGPNAKIFKTTDGGQNWNQLLNGLPNEVIGRIGLTISASNPQVLYAEYIGLDRQVYNVFKTTNGGQSWQETMPQDQVPDLLPGVLGGFGWYFGKIRVSPNDPDYLFLLGVDLWRSFDGGATWSEATPPWWEYSVHADKHDLLFAPNGALLLATDGGLYRSDDNAESWYDIENIPANQVYRVAVNPHEPDWCYGGLQDNGCAGGPDLSTEWLRIYGGDGFQMAFHPSLPEIVYAETQNGGIVVSTDFGNNWVSATDGISNSDRVHWDAPYFLSPHNPDVMYTGTFKVYKSLAGAVPLWEPVSEDLTDGVVFSPSFHTISTISESPVIEGLLYTGTTDGNVWQSDDGGSSWINIQDGLPDRYVTSVKGSPTLGSRVFVTHSGYKSNDFTAHIHRSDDRGGTWASVSGDLPQLAVNDLLILPGREDSVIFAATDGGVYGTTNGGNNWERLGTGMPFVAVYNLAWNAERNELVAGTHGRSIMTFPIDSIDFEPVTAVTNPKPGSISPYLVFPSPATTTFSIIPKSSESPATADLWVYDSSGNLIYKFQNANLQNQFNQFNLSNWKTGVYYILIKNKKQSWRHTLVKI